MSEVLEKLLGGSDLSEAEARGVMEEIMTGQWNDARVAGLLVALRGKGEATDEIVGFARVMREKALPLWEGEPALAVLDTCGTGGDNSGTFNISTAAALVAVGAGAVVAKHGNRAASSRSGSADVLEALGIDIGMPVARLRQCLSEVGFAFLFAQAFHSAMRFVMPARKALAIRTVFNILGPLANPAQAAYQVVGVASPTVLERMAEALGRLGVRHAFVVHGRDGVDEVSLAASTDVIEVREGRLRRFEITPEEAGLTRADRHELAGGDARENARIIEEVLTGVAGAPLDAVLLNAGLALVAAGLAGDLPAGVDQARASVSSGRALGKLRALQELSVK